MGFFQQGDGGQGGGFGQGWGLAGLDGVSEGQHGFAQGAFCAFAGFDAVGDAGAAVGVGVAFAGQFDLGIGDGARGGVAHFLQGGRGGCRRGFLRRGTGRGLGFGGVDFCGGGLGAGQVFFADEPSAVFAECAVVDGFGGGLVKVVAHDAAQGFALLGGVLDDLGGGGGVNFGGLGSRRSGGLRVGRRG